MKSSKGVKLGVNIDHVATLRQARKDIDPDPVAAAEICRQAGADMIVAHLRRDRRHIQDADLVKLCRQKGETHLEISAAAPMVAAALKAKPASVCLVPETPGEVTTLGGLDMKKGAKDLVKAVSALKRAGIETSLFISPDAESVRHAKALGADTIELCTTAYCEAKSSKNIKSEIEKLELAAYLADEMGLKVQAGHGLDYGNVLSVARIPHLDALNIGFSIVARAVFVGLPEAVAEMKRLVSEK